MSTLHKLLLWGCVFASASCTGPDTGDSEQEGVITQEARTTVFNSVMNGSAASFHYFTATAFAYLDVWEEGKGTVALNYMMQKADTSFEVCETYTYWDCPIPPGCGGGAAGMGGSGGVYVGGPVGGAGGGTGEPGTGATDGSPPDPSECCWPGEPGCCTLEECCVEVEETYCFYPRSIWEYGYGTIPKSAFQHKAKVARLDVTLSTGPQFSIQRCTEDWYNGVYECSMSEGGGPVSVVWTKEPGFESFRRGVEEQTYGPLTVRFNGTERHSTARVTGSFFDTPLVGVAGMLRSGKTVMHEIYRAH